ncbi:MAG: T9SS type A sorting domain-containing protein [Bacteroidales bacterium]|nr:T9SS type A sorting domain-containing protein [Bacteroidales bacterium]
MRKLLVVLLMAMMPGFALAQLAPFAPAQDQPGTTAMHADSSAFVGWATGCVAEPGPMNISNPSAGVAGAGYPQENAIGVPDGTYGVTCLGDGGYATLTFASPICNREGPDFAVFENGFKSGNLWFLEIAFVEVSSDGENFFRFPAVTCVQYETQLGGFATMDPAYIHNFAGKYGAFYGTPFDLDEVLDDPLLDKENITHVRVVDVVGSIDPEYATYDSQGHPVNDPWPTPFASSGFDLDAVGVIHDIAHYPTPPTPPQPQTVTENNKTVLSLYPNPADSYTMLQVETEAMVTIVDIQGRVINTFAVNGNELVRIETSGYKSGIYFVTVSNDVSRQTTKLFVK